jgi:flagellar motor switch protein FliM
MSLESESSASEVADSIPLQENAPGKRFDFRHPVFLSSPQWRKIRGDIDEFAEGVAALLSTYMRLEFTLQVGKLDTTSFNDFTAELPPATHLTLFKLEPLRGVSIIEIRPGIGLGIVDRLLGGPGKPATLDRTLTEMEVALMDQLVQLLLGEWCKQWKRFQELRAEIFGHENNPRFLQSSGGDTIMLLIVLDARMAECTGQIQIAIPYHAFEPVLTKLTETIPAATAPALSKAPSLKWNRSLDAVPINIRAQCPSFKMAARELFKLKVGEVVPLHPHCAEQIELRVGNLTKFRGRLGTREEKWAVQITEISKL